jgi:hypothetical protein
MILDSGVFVVVIGLPPRVVAFIPSHIIGR